MFRDYEADYSATLSAEEAEQQAEQGGGVQGEEEEEEGRGKLLLGMLPLGCPQPFTSILFFCFFIPKIPVFFLHWAHTELLSSISHSDIVDTYKKKKMFRLGRACVHVHVQFAMHRSRTHPPQY